MANVGVGVNDPAHVHDGEPVNQGRRRFLTATTAVVGAVGAGFVAVPFIKSWNPSAKAKLAGAPITADISALADGTRMVLEWRGQPIWIVKRTKQMLDVLPTLDVRLRDPKSTNLDQQPEYARNEFRSIKPEISSVRGAVPVQATNGRRATTASPWIRRAVSGLEETAIPILRS